MFKNIFAGLLFTAATQSANSSLPPHHLLAQHEMSLDKRYSNAFVNDVFKDNILLTLNYLRNEVKNPNQIKWNEIEKPFSFQMKLMPDTTFAFHDSLLPQFENTFVTTTNAHFDSNEGFKSDGYLIGDGVCHLASLLNWTASDAGLINLAPTNHNFANIPEVPQKYGVAIYDQPGETSSS